MKTTLKHLIIGAVALFSSTVLAETVATEITPTTLIGKYKVEASVFFQKIYGNFNVHNQQEFDFQRTYPNGKVEEICSGTYTLSAGFVPLFNEFGEITGAARLFKGIATCPSDRSKNMEFDVEFSASTKIEDLVRGTTVKIRTSMAGGMPVNAYVKKQ